MAKTSFDSIIDNFLEHTIQRTNSIQRYNTKQIIRPQNVMEHEGAVTFIAMVLSDHLNSVGVRNDTEKVLRIAITHDKDEVVSGDVNYDAKYSHGKISKDLRRSLDRLGDHVIQDLYGRLNNKKLAKRYYDLYREEKGKKSVEAKIVKMADYIDVILYARNEQSLGNREMAIVEKGAHEGFSKIFNELAGK
ncbi:MAG: HD domain-containing protein [Candidatus Micrarchaeota archaeon]|nr:HD domain-containing protein [Candidatus Micrarchaeota archaeon]